MAKDNKKSDFNKMVRELGLSKKEIAEMLGLTMETRGKGQGKYSSYNKGGVAKKAAKKAPAKKAYAKGGVAKKKTPAKK